MEPADAFSFTFAPAIGDPDSIGIEDSDPVGSGRLAQSEISPLTGSTLNSFQPLHFRLSHSNDTT